MDSVSYLTISFAISSSLFRAEGRKTFPAATERAAAEVAMSGNMQCNRNRPTFDADGESTRRHCNSSLRGHDIVYCEMVYGLIDTAFSDVFFGMEIVVGTSVPDPSQQDFLPVHGTVCAAKLNWRKRIFLQGITIMDTALAFERPLFPLS